MKITGSIVNIGQREEDGSTVIVFTVAKKNEGYSSGAVYYQAVFWARDSSTILAGDMMDRLTLAKEGQRYTFEIEGDSEPPTGANVNIWKTRVSVIGVEPAVEVGRRTL